MEIQHYPEMSILENEQDDQDGVHARPQST